MRDVSFGQYYPCESPVHRLDPRVKLLLTILYVVMIFFVRDFIVFGFMALMLLFIVLISHVPVFSVLRSVRGIMVLIIFTAVLNIFFYSAKSGDTLLGGVWVIKIYKEGLMNAGRLALRIILLVIGTSILTLTTTPVALTDGLESLLKPLKLVKFPVHELALIMSIALKLIPNLIEETEKIVNAQKARGADFESGNIFKKAKAMLPVLIPLFVNSFRRADELAYAMDSRCYKGSKGRTRMKQLKLGLRDLVSALIMIGFFVTVVLIYSSVITIPFLV